MINAVSVSALNIALGDLHTGRHVQMRELSRRALYSSAQAIMEDCREPNVSDLVIEEVLIDGEPSEESEFVEVQNRSRELLRLDGVSLYVKRGANMKKKYWSRFRLCTTGRHYFVRSQ